MTSDVVPEPPDSFRICRIGLKNRMNSGPFAFTEQKVVDSIATAKIRTGKIDKGRIRGRGSVQHAGEADEIFRVGIGGKQKAVV